MGTGSFAALGAGWSMLWRHKRLWFWIWAIHVAGAYFMARSFERFLDSVLANRLAATELGGPQSFAIITEVLANYSDRLPSGPGMATVVVVYVWLGTVMSGGILGRLSSNDGRPFLHGFLGDCGLYAARFTRLLLVQLAAFAAAGFAFFSVFGIMVAAWTAPFAEPSRGLLVGAGIVAGMAFLVYSTLVIVSDYAKVRIVREERRSALVAWFAGVGWALPRIIRTFGLHLSFVVLAVAGSAVFLLLAPDPSAAVVLVVLYQQAYLLFRVGVRVQWYGAELALYDGLSAPAAQDSATEEE